MAQNRVPEPTLFEQQTEFSILPREYIQKFKSLDATPDVKNIKFFLANNSAPFTITNFLKAADAQRLHILGDGFTTIAYNTKIKTNTGANKLLSTEKIYKFTYLNNIWYEDVDAGAAGAGTGEANTSSNAGLTGQGLVLAKIGVDLPFKSLTAGANITVTNDAANKSLVIASTSGGSVSKTMLLTRG